MKRIVTTVYEKQTRTRKRHIYIIITSLTLPIIMGNCGSRSKPEAFNDFPLIGIKVSYICNEYLEDCGGETVLAGLTTGDICKKFIKPSTQVEETSYCDMVMKSERGKENVGKPTAYICHSWTCEFLYLITALRARFKDEPETYIWLDIFSFNQHKVLYLDQYWCTHLLLPAIQEIENTFMVVDSIEKPLVYTRTWCMLEAYSSHLSAGKFELIMSDEVLKEFWTSAVLDPKKSLDRLKASIDSRKSTVTRVDDRSFLHELFEIEAGMTEMDNILFRQARSFLIGLTKIEIEKSSNDLRKNEKIWDMLNIYYSYMGNGKYEPSKEMLEDNLDERYHSLGENHPETQRAMHDLGVHHLKEGRYDEAKEIMVNCLRLRKATVGMTDRETVKLIADLTTVYEKKHDYKNAERLYRELLGQQRESLGASHADTLSSLLSLKTLRKSQQKKRRSTETPMRATLLKLKKSSAPN